MRRMSAVAVILAVAAVSAAPVFAQDSKDDLRKEVEQLRKDVETLKQEKKAEPAPAPAAKDGALMKLGDDSTVLDMLLRETKVNGFVDVGFIWNFDRPDNGFNGNLPSASTPAAPPLSGSVRAFDQKSRSFYLHNAQLNLNRAATKELITGYNVELSFGSDPNVFGAGPGGGGDYYDVQEANIEILAPVGNGIDIRIGKFATFAGAEVIESKDNFNYSRSLPFMWAIPFTHTGIRATYFLDTESQYSVSLGVNNGWDNVEDNNDAKTLEAQFFANPKQASFLKFYANFYYGAEKNPGPTFGDDNGDKRMLIDLVLAVANIPGLEKFSGYINLDIGEEDESSVLTPQTGTTVDDAEWLGFAIAGKYQLNDEWALAARYSMIDDSEGFRTGGFIDPITGNTEENTISEITLTLEYRISKDTIARLEFRHDMSDEDIFLDHNKVDDAQSTLGAEFILTF